MNKKPKSTEYDIDLKKNIYEYIDLYGEKATRQMFELIFEEKRKYDKLTKYRAKKEMTYDSYYKIINHLFFSQRKGVFTFQEWDMIAFETEKFYEHYKHKYNDFDLEQIIADAKELIKKEKNS